MRVGDVALDAFDDQRAGQRTAPAVLDHVADQLVRSGFADDAIVDCFAACLQCFHYANRAVHRYTLFIRSDQQRDRAVVFWMLREKRFNRGDECRDGSLHVCRAAPV